MRPLARLAQLAVTWLALAVVLFHLLDAMPGRAADARLLADPRLGPADLERLAAHRGENRSTLARFGCWWLGRPAGVSDADLPCAWWAGGGLLRGDLGWSTVHQRPVVEVLAGRLPNTLRLMIPAFGLAAGLALGLGMLAARRRGRWSDRVVLGFAALGTASPSHWIGLLAIGGLALGLGWFPVGGVDDPRSPSVLARVHHALLPVLVLVLVFAARWVRHVRSAMLGALAEDAVRLARAKGLSEARVLVAHALRAAAGPIALVMTDALPALFSGAVVTERVFSYPGIGLLMLESLTGDDRVVAMTVFLAYAALTMASTWLGDLVQAWIDPRLRGLA
jgi:peptide/nickel transport system permease protein